jgi:hypothetical protein
MIWALPSSRQSDAATWGDITVRMALLGKTSMDLAGAVVREGPLAKTSPPSLSRLSDESQARGALLVAG